MAICSRHRIGSYRSTKKQNIQHKERYTAICAPTRKTHIETHIAIYPSLCRGLFLFADTGIAVKTPIRPSLCKLLEEALSIMETSYYNKRVPIS